MSIRENIGSRWRKVGQATRQKSKFERLRRKVRIVGQRVLDKIVPLRQRHLRKIISEYVDHYHGERNHQGLDNRLIEPMQATARSPGPIKCTERLGGVLNYYYREVA